MFILSRHDQPDRLEIIDLPPDGHLGDVYAMVLCEAMKLAHPKLRRAVGRLVATDVFDEVLRTEAIGSILTLNRRCDVLCELQCRSTSGRERRLVANLYNGSATSSQ